MHSFVRSVKYFVHLCVLCAAVILVMHLADMLAVAPAELPALLFASWRGWVLAAAVVLLSAAIPLRGSSRGVWRDFSTTTANGS